MDEQTRLETSEGFTLLELMIVVLVLGFLIAIAVPSFLSLTSSARSKGLESNLQIALSDENTYYTAYSVYGTTSSIPTIGSIDAGVTWLAYPTGGITETSTTKDVYVQTVSPSDGTAALVLGAASPAGGRYWVYIDGTDGVLKYAVTTTAAAPSPSQFTAQTWAAAGG